MNNVVLYYPTLAPIWAYQARLICSWRGPGSSRMSHLKAFYSNIINACSFWIETASSYIYFSQLYIWIIPMEIGVDRGICIIDLYKPDVFSLLRIMYLSKLICPII